MMRLLVYLLFFGVILYLLSHWNKQMSINQQGGNALSKRKFRFRSKSHPKELWMQVYETASLEEARAYQARLEEQEVDCLLYEQGKKDIHGNPLTGIGIAVPKSMSRMAQEIIARLSI